MDILLSKVTQQAMNYAIRTGITITSGYAIRQCGRLLKTVDGREKEELASLQLRLEGKIRIISPAIDMIELIAARGNTSLESAVTLTKSLRWEIQALGVRLAKAVGEERLTRHGSSKSKSREQNDLELKLIIADIKRLLERIEDAVPMINLAITTSGVNLSTTLPNTVSPSRLLQASTFLTAGDTEYCMTMPRSQQIGPTFTLSMYMLFSGHAYRPHDEEGIRETTWKEVMHKARVKLLRVPLDNVFEYPSRFETGGTTTAESAEGASIPQIPSEGKAHEFAYQILIIEDLDDDRVHTFEDPDTQPGPYEGVEVAGIREIIPIHEISKIFYADTGKILNIGTDGETNNPILLLKRDPNAVPPRRMMEAHTVEPDYDSDESRTVNGSGDELDDEEAALQEQLRRESTAHTPEEPSSPGEPQRLWRLPPNLDPEWMAFEVYTEEPPSESEFDDEESELPEIVLGTPSTSSTSTPSDSPSLVNKFADINLSPSTHHPVPNSQIVPSPQKPSHPSLNYNTPRSTALPAIKTSLSLLEMLIRLTALQQFQQTSHLAIPDELLTFFLSEAATVGAGADPELRRRARREARLRVGFDPYDESPIKRRGEEYLEHEFHPGEGVEGDEEQYDEGSAYGRERERTGTPSAYDYSGYPYGRVRSTRSRSNTPLLSSPLPRSSPVPPQHGAIPSPDYPLPSRERDFRNRYHHTQQMPSPSNMSSASPLLRRAITQPGGGNRLGLKQPVFRGTGGNLRVGGNIGAVAGPPTAPPTSSSPRVGGNGAVGGTKEKNRDGDPDKEDRKTKIKGVLDTPPSSGGKECKDSVLSKGG